MLVVSNMPGLPKLPVLSYRNPQFPAGFLVTRFQIGENGDIVPSQMAAWEWPSTQRVFSNFSARLGRPVLSRGTWRRRSAGAGPKAGSVSPISSSSSSIKIECGVGDHVNVETQTRCCSKAAHLATNARRLSGGPCWPD